MWVVGKRYLNDSHFVKSREFENQYALRPVDKMILEDRDPNYRVLDLSINTFNDAHVSYHHKTIGGYSPVKMQRYQDLIDRHISAEMQQIGKDISGCKTIEEAQEKIGNYPVLNMLNTRYIVLGAENAPVVNSGAFGNGWFVNRVIGVNSTTEEIASLSKIENSLTAVIHNEFSADLQGASQDSLQASEAIVLTEYSPNKLEYKASSNQNRVAIFSEIYYPAGWKAYIDGKEVKILRANYTLRALNIPAGEHIVIFEFKPESFAKGEFWSRITSGVLVLLLFAAAIGYILNGYRQKQLKS